MRVSKKVRAQVFDRDDWTCVCCGTTYGLSLQHRAGAGMGGSKTLHTVQNLIVMCSLSNARLESDADFAAFGTARGWKIRRHQNPLDVPVYYAAEDAWYYLTHRGTRFAF